MCIPEDFYTVCSVKSVAELMGAATSFSGSFRARNRVMEDDSSLLNNIGKFNVCKKLFFKFSVQCTRG